MAPGMAQEGTGLPSHVVAAAQAAVAPLAANAAAVPRFRGPQYVSRGEYTFYQHATYPNRDMGQLVQRFAYLCDRAGVPRDLPFYVIGHRYPKRPDLNNPMALIVSFEAGGEFFPMIDERFMARLNDNQVLAVMAHELYHYLHPNAPQTATTELAADRFAAQLTGHPEALSQALAIREEVIHDQYLLWFQQTYPGGCDLQGRDVETAYQQEKAESDRTGYHPPLAERQEKLRLIREEMNLNEGRGR